MGTGSNPLEAMADLAEVGVYIQNQKALAGAVKAR
jgi:hypothetical protein